MIVLKVRLEMTLTTYDANGNVVGGTSTFCARCGAHIKYVFTFDGKTYGSECIEVVTGIGKDYQVFSGRVLDLEASKAKKVQAESDKATRLAQYEANRKAAYEVQQANLVRFEEVIYLLSRTPGDFCASVVGQIKRSETSTELYNILSPCTFDIVGEIYGKAFGRKGSKAYEAGINEFYEKYGERE